MRSLDRAMCALFLLILVADVARAQALAPVGGDASGGFMLSAATQVLASPDDESLEERPARGVRPGVSLAPSRSASQGIFSRLRAASKEQKLHTLQARSLFDSLTFATVAAVSPEPIASSGLEPVTRLQIGAPAAPVAEHVGSPAP